MTFQLSNFIVTLTSVFIIVVVSVVQYCHFENVLEPVTSTNSHLVFVTILHRHGERAPFMKIFNKPGQTEDPGELTRLGENQTYELGKWLRKRYATLLPEKYNRNDIYVQSSDVDRAIMSALCCSAGIYMTKVEENFISDMPGWQPVPIHSLNAERDNYINNQRKCPKRERKLAEFKNSDEMVEYFQTANRHFTVYKELYKNFNKTQELINKIKNNGTNLIIETEFKSIKAQASEIMKIQLNTSNIGDDLSTLDDIQTLNVMSKIEDPNQYLEYLRGKMLSNILEYYNMNNRISTYKNTELKRLYGGVLINEIETYIDKKIAKDITQRMRILSGHDTTLTQFMQTLDIFNGKNPPFASCLMIELHKMNSEQGNDSFRVAIFYRNDTTIEPIQLKLPDCDFFCGWNKFKKIVKQFSISNEDWELECNS